MWREMVRSKPFATVIGSHIEPADRLDPVTPIW
jgi:hypothetical protein